MPTYQFRCSSCGVEFEGIQGRDEASGIPCPTCGAAAGRLMGGGGGFVLRHSADSSGNRRAAVQDVAPRSTCHGERPTDGSCRRERTGVGCCGAKEPCGHPGSGRPPTDRGDR